MNETERVRSQTNEQWLQEYEVGKNIPSVAIFQNHDDRYVTFKTNTKDENCRTIGSSNYEEEFDAKNEYELEFDSHRTTKNGSVILAFTVIELFEEAVIFFNCDIYRQRGELSGKKYRTGAKGQFLPPHLGKFRKFWMKSIGVKPRRWSSVHKSIASHLRRVKFSGNIVLAKKNDGGSYLKISALFVRSKHGERKLVAN